MLYVICNLICEKYEIIVICWDSNAITAAVIKDYYGLLCGSVYSGLNDLLFLLLLFLFTLADWWRIE